MDIKLEKTVHGENWNKAHGGYFSNKTVSADYLTEILKIIENTKPDILVDLGGGTGYILSELIHKGISENIKLINLDLSDAQIAQIHSSKIKAIKGSFSKFKRKELTNHNQQLMLIARSVLHYVEKEDLANLLAHIRSQMQPGEVFLHQTACFKNKHDADCLNSIYEQMNTDKWYPTLTELHTPLEKNGFEIIDVKAAPALPLKREELSERYKISSEKMAAISKKLLTEFGTIRKVLEFSNKSFTAYLHYHIFFCRAI